MWTFGKYACLPGNRSSLLLPLLPEHPKAHGQSMSLLICVSVPAPAHIQLTTILPRISIPADLRNALLCLTFPPRQDTLCGDAQSATTTVKHLQKRSAITVTSPFPLLGDFTQSKNLIGLHSIVPSKLWLMPLHFCLGKTQVLTKGLVKLPNNVCQD